MSDLILEKIDALITEGRTGKGQRKRKATSQKHPKKEKKARVSTKARKPRNTNASSRKKKTTETVVQEATINTPKTSNPDPLALEVMRQFRSEMEKTLPVAPAWPEELHPLLPQLSTDQKACIRTLKKQYDMYQHNRKSNLDVIERLYGRQHIHDLRFLVLEIHTYTYLCHDIIVQTQDIVSGKILAISSWIPLWDAESQTFLAEKDECIISSSVPSDKLSTKKGDLSTTVTGRAKKKKAINKAPSQSNHSSLIYRTKNAIEQDKCPYCNALVMYKPDASENTCPNWRCGAALPYQANINANLSYGEEMEFSQNTQEFRKAYRKFLAPFLEQTRKPPTEVIDCVIQGLSYVHAKSIHIVLRSRIKAILNKNGYGNRAQGS